MLTKCYLGVRDLALYLQRVVIMLTSEDEIVKKRFILLQSFKLSGTAKFRF